MKTTKNEAGVRFDVFEDADAVAQKAVTLILSMAERSIAQNGHFRIVLAGGGTPLSAYKMLRDKPADWHLWEVFYGDERCLPPDDAERNSKAAFDALIGQVPIPPENHFPIPAELGAEQAAEAYEKRVLYAVPFDLVLLGLGEDGHTASLFPGHEIDDTQSVVAVHGSPKPPADRVSLTPNALADCAEMLFLVTGSGKRDAMSAWRAGFDLPVASVAAMAGRRARVLVDRAAYDE